MADGMDVQGGSSAPTGGNAAPSTASQAPASGAAPAAQTSEQSVPYTRFKEVNDRLREAEAFRQAVERGEHESVRGHYNKGWTDYDAQMVEVLKGAGVYDAVARYIQARQSGQTPQQATAAVEGQGAPKPMTQEQIDKLIQDRMNGEFTKREATRISQENERNFRENLVRGMADAGLPKELYDDFGPAVAAMINADAAAGKQIRTIPEYIHDKMVSWQRHYGAIAQYRPAPNMVPPTGGVPALSPEEAARVARRAQEADMERKYPGLRFHGRET